MITLQIVGLEELARKYGVDLKPALRAATFAIGEELRNKIAKYPGPRSGPVQWASRKQQIWYLAMRRERGLPLKYTRQSDPMSQRLGPSWATGHHGDTDAIVAPKATYAKWVQSAEFQQPMHKATGWVTDVQAIEQVQREGKARDIVRDALFHAMGER